VARPSERLGEPRTDGARELGPVAERFRRPALTRLGRPEARSGGTQRGSRMGGVGDVSTATRELATE